MKKLVLKNASAALPEALKACDLLIIDGKIAEIGENISTRDAEVFDCKGQLLTPGLVDTHIHGATGLDAIDINENNISKLTKYQAAHGVTSIALTFCDTPICDGLYSHLESLSEILDGNYVGARIRGIHYEGPFLNLNKKGAISEKFICQPSLEIAERLVSACRGKLKIMTLAPENDGADAVIEYLVKNGVRVSLGHTEASSEVAERAFSLGADRITHTFNAMKPFSHRDSGVLGAAFCNDDVTCEAICDFFHLEPRTVKTLIKIKGADRVCAISDSISGAGIKGEYTDRDGRLRTVRDGLVYLSDGTISGSAVSLDAGFKNLVSIGTPISDVVKMTSTNPAKALGLENILGSIEEGKLADLVMWSKDYEPIFTFVGGEQVK